MSGLRDSSEKSTHPPAPSLGGRGSLPGTREWYADGLRFECTQCGNCCTGPPGFVWFNEAEGRAMAAALGVSESEFYTRHARREGGVGGHWSLKERKTEKDSGGGGGYDCTFLDRESIPGKAICGIYHARPTQCRTWPFWPENLKSESSWQRVKRQTPCPGMSRGPLITIEQIRIQRDRSSL